MILYDYDFKITDSDDERIKYLHEGHPPMRGKRRGRSFYNRFRGGRRRERNSEAEMNGDHQEADGGEMREDDNRDGYKGGRGGGRGRGRGGRRFYRGSNQPRYNSDRHPEESENYHEGGEGERHERGARQERPRRVRKEYDDRGHVRKGDVEREDEEAEEGGKKQGKRWWVYFLYMCI